MSFLFLPLYPTYLVHKGYLIVVKLINMYNRLKKIHFNLKQRRIKESWKREKKVDEGGIEKQEKKKQATLSFLCSSPFLCMTILFNHFQHISPYNQNRKLPNMHAPVHTHTCTQTHTLTHNPPPSKFNLSSYWYESIVKKSTSVCEWEFWFVGDRRREISFLLGLRNLGKLFCIYWMV